MRYHGACHCGHVRFSLAATIDHLRQCNCSVCHKRGALMVRVEDTALQLHTPLEDLTVYTWGSGTAKDYFCPHCGILPFRRPSAPTAAEQAQGAVRFEGWAINARCLAGFDPATVPVKQIDGLSL